MPPSQRKSSVGTARRALPKAYIPYRGDNPEVGKKTGIAVQHVQRKSDGFEPFEEVMQQADGWLPPKPKRQRKKSSIVQYDDEDEEDEDDEYGEMDMQLDSPVHSQNLASMRAPTTPTTNGRAGPSSSKRPVARSSNVDFDKIPSPRPRNAKNSTAGPSRLARTYIAEVEYEEEEEVEEDDPNDQTNNMDQDQQYDDEEDDDMQVDGGGGGGFDSFGPQETVAEGSSPRKTSFTQMDQDDDDDDENEPFFDDPPPFSEEPEEQPRSPTPKPPSKTNKGKGRAVEDDATPPPRSGTQKSSSNKSSKRAAVREPSLPQDDDMEDDIAHGLEDISNTHHQSDVEDEEEPEPELPTPKPKKVKIAQQEKPKRTVTQTLGRKENREPQDGVRRSTREHYKPLEYWRGEKVVYGRPDYSGQVLVPHIREIIRIPKEQPEPLGKRKRGRSRSRTAPPTSKTGGPAPAVVGAAIGGLQEDSEDGWDDETPSNAKVLDYKTGAEVERRIAWTRKMVNPRPVANNSWSFDKIFGDADFIAAGQLVIPPNSRKPTKATKDNTYIFYVIEGAVNLKVHDTSMVLATGGMFMVPRGNTYFIENISQRDAKIFFTQARKTVNDEDESVIALANKQKKRTQRSSSAGAMGRGTPGRGTPGRATSVNRPS